MAFRTTEEWEDFVGKELKTQRLRQNLSQEEVARRAEIGVATLVRLEAGKGSSLQTFISVLKVLKLDDWLEQLAPQASISPLQIKQLGKMRQRAARSRSSSTTRDASAKGRSTAKGAN